jgi:hydrogenase expression/formation protein HypC
MCLSVPGQVLDVDGPRGRVDVAGNTVETDFSLTPDVQPGDYVLVHAGFAIQKYDEEEALATLQMLDEAFETAPNDPA